MMAFDEVETATEVMDSVALFALASGLLSEEVKRVKE